MEQSEIRQLLQAVAAGERSVDDALLQLKEAPFEDLGFAKLDHHRALRQGAAEVIYGAGKTPEQILKITQAMLHHGQKLHMRVAHVRYIGDQLVGDLLIGQHGLVLVQLP